MNWNLFLKPIYTVLFIIGLHLQSCSPAQPQSETKKNQINQHVKTYHDYHQFNGAILVAFEGRVIYKKGFGKASFEWDIPNRPDTKFQIASVSKQFTSMLIMQLVAEGKLDLRTPIGNYLNDYPKPQGDLITIQHLLNHTSGIPNHTSFPSYRTDMLKFIRPEGLIQTFSDSTLLFTPGSQFNYSNSGYALLGFLLEKIEGKPYGKILNEKIFSPLGMKNSGYEPTQRLVKNKASGYSPLGLSYLKANYIDYSEAYSSGGIHSTVEDLFIWDQSLYSEKLLPKSFLDSLFSPKVQLGNSHYANGWDIGEIQIGNTSSTLKSISHDGVINGYTALITRIPSEKTSIIILNNTGGAPLHHMTKGILGILHGSSFDKPVQSVAISVGQEIEKNGIEKGVENYKAIKDQGGFYLSENEMNLMGYDFLERGNLDAAKEIFRLNVEAFPDSFRVYDSYGEILMELGEIDLSIMNYQKSLELNPTNGNAKRFLKLLESKTYN